LANTSQDLCLRRMSLDYRPTGSFPRGFPRGPDQKTKEFKTRCDYIRVGNYLN